MSFGRIDDRIESRCGFDVIVDGHAEKSEFSEDVVKIKLSV